MVNFIKSIDLFFLTLFYSLLFFRIIGIALVEIIFFFLIIYYFTKYKNSSFTLFKDNKLIFLLSFSIYVSINHLFQYDNFGEKYFEYSSFLHIRYFFLTIITIYCLDKSFKKNLFLLPILAFLIAYVVLIPDSFLQFFTGKNFIGNNLINFRVSSFFGDDLILGSFIIKTFPLILFISILFQKKLKKYFFPIVFFTTLFSSILIFLSGGRTSFYLLIIFLILIYFFIKSLRKILSISYLFAIIFIFMIAQLNTSGELVNRIFIKPFHQITNGIYANEKLNTLEEDDRKLSENLRVFSNDHHNHYKLALHLFIENPIFGVGPKGFRYYCRSIQYNSKIGMCTTHPHNYLIQIISELGLIGIFFYTTSLFFVILNILKTNKVTSKKFDHHKKNLFTLSSIIILINFFPFSPSGNFFNNWLSIVNYYSIGFYIYSFNKFFKNA